MKPSNWGQDELSEFLQTAEDNSIASFANLQGEYKRLVSVDSLFLKLTRNLNNSPDWYLAPFVVRAHSCFRSACRASLSGQLVETYILLRGALENALYALHINTDRSRYETWIKREDGATEKKACRRAFQISKILEQAKTRLPSKIHSIADELYDRSIDNGAHPNCLGSLINLEITDTSESKQIKIIYLHNEPDYIYGMMKECSRYGCAVLHILKEIFSHRFEILGLPAELNAVSQEI